MDGRLSKYFGANTDSSGNPLFWSHPDEYPFRGMPPTMLKNEEVEEIPLIYEAKSAMLELPQDQGKYDDIIDHCANGAWQLRHEKFMERDDKLFIFMSWLEIYRQTPNGKVAWEMYRNAVQ